MVYRDIKTIITIVGNANFSRVNTLNFCAIEFVILFFTSYCLISYPMLNYRVTR